MRARRWEVSDVRSIVQHWKLAYSTLAFPGRQLSDVVAMGKAMGYDGIELRLIDGELIDPSMSSAARDRVKRIVGDVPVVAVDSSIRITEDDPIPAIASFLELAHAWEAPVVRVFGGDLPEDPSERQRALEHAARVLESAAAHAERLGVAVGLETHDSFAGSSQVAEVLAMVPSPWIGAVWDSHHPHRMGETPEEIYANIGPRTKLAQVKDARRSSEQPSGWQLVPLGEGEVPVRDMLSVLAHHGYAGVISVEWEKRWHPEIDEPEIALPQHLELLKRWMAELAGPGGAS